MTRHLQGPSQSDIESLQPGDRVRIEGKHPWKGCTGKFVGVEVIEIYQQKYPVVELDEADGVPPGQRCFVFAPARLVKVKK